MLLGRDRELHAIDSVLQRARAGESATLALVGEPGIGKTALLEAAAERARGMTLLRARGIESEAEIPFASLLELLRPALSALNQIPEPQAVALQGALALRPASGHERFAVGAATLSLLAALAEHQPVAVLIDDAQWLDRSSEQTLLFAFRRLIADPVAVVLTVREGQPSLLASADLPTMTVGGLDIGDAAALLDALEPQTVARLHRATAGNPLALLELAADPGDMLLAPDDAPLLVSAQIGRVFTDRLSSLDEPERRAVTLAATSDSGELAVLEAAASALGIELSKLSAAEAVGLVSVRGGYVAFRHPLARSAIYAAAGADERRAAHQALARALPDRDVDRRAWHFAAAATGTDDTAAAALEQAGIRARERSAYAAAAAAFERAARLTAEPELRARRLFDSAQAAWGAGDADRAIAALDEARGIARAPALVLDVDELRGHIATRRGPVLRGREVLAAAAEKVDGERSVAMLAEAALACFYAGSPREMDELVQRAQARLPANAAPRAEFLLAAASGMAAVLGGDAAAGSDALHEAIAVAERADLFEDSRLLPWLVLPPIFLRETQSGRSLIERALATARGRAAVGALPFVLNLIARDEATTDRWSAAEAAYREAIALARENDQRTDIAFSLSGLAWLLARRGEEAECRALAGEALALSRELGTELHVIWATAALGDLELGLGDPAAAVEHYERQQQLLQDRAITDPDLSPAPELAEAYLRMGRKDDAQRVGAEFLALASAKRQPWSLGRALRAVALGAEDVAVAFEAALEQQALTPDVFEVARTRLAYGERLRRTRRRVLARPQLRAALEDFERLGARPWAERARAELAATGETMRRRDPTALDELTPQELQIALLLADGRTTREAAAAVFLSPKTIEYHLRHVYMKLGISSRQELAKALAPTVAPAERDRPHGSAGSAR
jgi:DNA-binding CsgD family transcriptional regulator